MRSSIDLVPQYIQILKQESENSEQYKWTAVQHFQENWQDECSDDEFYEMFKKAFAKRENLIFQNSFGFLNSLAKAMPHEAKQLLNYLFQDEVPLETRIPEYQQRANSLLPNLKFKIGKENINHQQDERTISFLLTLHNPEKYYLYKDNVYQALCKYLEIGSRRPGEKYLHFHELGEEARKITGNSEDLQKCVEIQNLLSSYSFDSYNLLFQDIIYRTLIVASGNERNKELMNQIVEDIKSTLLDRVHDLVNHTWVDNDSTNFRQVSVLKNVAAYPLHYELMMHSDIAWEFHAEGDRNQKEYMEPFIQEYDKTKYKLIPWKHSVSGPYKQGEFHKISPKHRLKVEDKGVRYQQMIDELTNQFIELYNDTNNRLIDFLKNNPSTVIQVDSQIPKMNSTPLNQILYGPPGTGKTYSTIDKVIEICEPALFAVNDHKQNKELYDQLLKEGRVVFTTFHQSMSYEDFIEGIKPLKPGDEDEFLKYDVEPGLFKQIANTAKNLKTITTTNIDWDNVNYYKMSIGGKNRPDIHNWCIENNVVGLSWGGEEDLSELVSKTNGQGWKKYRDDFKEMFPNTVEKNRYNIQASYILNKMKLGDIVVISKGNHVIDAIGKIVGEYYFDDQTPTDMFHFRKVEWIATDLDTSPEKFIDKQISQQSIYEFYDLDVKKEAFKGLTAIETTEEKPYVLVIDEINRGNVSAIFGELITLIEQDKRLGQENELKVTLPYSKDKFGVPSNLYILGTMNTADRSVEALDTALRRRFSFVEMMPNPELLKDKTVLGINLKELLSKINQRIEALIDRDHTIGHAYLIDVENDNEDDLKRAFKDKIIPLLQEYFFGDYGKIGLVLGSGFVKKGEIKDSIFSEFEYEGREGLFQTTYELITFDEVKFEEALKTLMK